MSLALCEKKSGWNYKHWLQTLSSVHFSSPPTITLIITEGIQFPRPKRAAQPINELEVKRLKFTVKETD